MMTDNTKTREAHFAYMANRKEAGRVIDIETCEMASWHVNYFDPYATFPFDDDLSDNPLLEQARDDISECWFVRSEESGGWIEWGDLPPEKQQAMDARVERERKPRERMQKTVGGRTRRASVVRGRYPHRLVFPG